jgi:hypothetical protein
MRTQVGYNVSGLILPDLFKPTSIHTYKKYLNPSGDPVPLRPYSSASDQIAAGSPGISEIYVIVHVPSLLSDFFFSLCG